MMISGANTYPDTTVVPDGNAPALASAVQQLGSDLADRTTFMLAHTVAAQQPLNYECADGDNIVFGPVFGVVSFDTMPRYMQVPTETTLTAANIEGGIAPIGSSFYYIYMYWSAGPKFEISLTEPDAYRIYKSTGSSKVLVGIAQTDSTAKFTRVRGLRGEVRYLVPPQVKNPAATGATPEIVDLITKLPPIADVCGLSVNGNTSVAVIDALSPFVAVGPADFDPTTFRKLRLPNNLIGGRCESDVEVPLGHRPTSGMVPGNDRKLAILTDSSTSTIELFLTKYRY